MSTVNSATSAASSTSASAAASKAPKIASDFNAFLKLLTTQLQNQDPSAPMDANAFTAQLVQFASVEQQISMNSSLESMISLEQGAQLTASAPLMGKLIEVESDRLSLQGGSAQVRLPKAGPASTARVAVLDEAGRTIREESLALGASPKTWVWDGKNSAGKQMTDGAYRVAVTGTDAAGTSQQVSFGVIARATGAERVNGSLNLALGGLAVGFDKVRSLVGG